MPEAIARRGSSEMFESNHARLSSAGKWKTLIAVASFTFFASQAFANPQSEISAYRKSYGLPAVTVDPKLTELARQQATAMAERGSIGHNVYASFGSRIASYGAASAAENLAMGTRTFGDTFAIWKSSSGHNANLLKADVTRIGVASASRQGKTYWALILAAPPKAKQSNTKVLSIFPFVMLVRIGSP
jgi:uncharacterized protein YkwD